MGVGVGVGVPVDGQKMNSISSPTLVIFEKQPFSDGKIKFTNFPLFDEATTLTLIFLKLKCHPYLYAT